MCCWRFVLARLHPLASVLTFSNGVRLWRLWRLLGQSLPWCASHGQRDGPRLACGGQAGSKDVRRSLREVSGRHELLLRQDKGVSTDLRGSLWRTQPGQHRLLPQPRPLRWVGHVHWGRGGDQRGSVNDHYSRVCVPSCIISNCSSIMMCTRGHCRPPIPPPPPVTYYLMLCCTLGVYILGDEAQVADDWVCCGTH